LSRFLLKKLYARWPEYEMRKWEAVFRGALQPLKEYGIFMKKALTIAGSDTIAGAGIQADLKTFAALGVYGASVITSVTAQNTEGIQGIIDLPSRFVALQIESVLSDIHVDSIKIGLLPNNEIIKIVGSKLKEHNVKNVVLDPVIFPKEETPLVHPGAKDNLINKLFPLSLIVTPNIPEARYLTGISIKNYSDIKEAAKKIYKLGARNVLIKGGHFRGKAVDTFYNGKVFKFFEAKRFPNKNVHGTGCALASAIAAELAKGISLITAIQRAKSFITGAITHSAQIGHGSHVINHFLDLYRERDKFKMLGEMETALDVLKKREIGPFIPEVQSNLGYALESAKSKEDIMAFPDRIIKKGSRVISVSGPRFGCSNHISSIILAAMSHDPTKRAAMNIKYLPEIINVCKKNKLSIASFSRDNEPKSVKIKEGSSLDWGVKQAIKKFGLVPDIIYDTGGMGKEPMIRVLANNPSNVADIILKIKQNISKRL